MTCTCTTYVITYLLFEDARLVYSQQANQVDAWVEQYKSHANFGYIFKENGRDVLNKQNPESVKKTLKYLTTLC